MKPRYVANYLVRQNGGLQWIGSKRFKPSDTTITLYGEEFVIDIARPLYRNRRGWFVYMFEQGQGQIYSISDTPGISPKLVKAVFGQEIIRQLVTGLDQAAISWNQIIWAVMGALGGVGIGWVLCSALGG